MKMVSETENLVIKLEVRKFDEVLLNNKKVGKIPTTSSYNKSSKKFFLILPYIL